MRNIAALIASGLGLTLGNSNVDDKLNNVYFMLGFTVITSLIRIFGLTFIFRFDTP